MEILDQDNGCCGSNFRQKNITFLGLLTFGFPIFVFSSFLTLALYPLKNKNLILMTKIQILKEASGNLISEFNLFPKLKCTIVAKFMRFSPRFSGFIFKTFNFFVISISFIFVGLFLIWILE